MAKSIFIVPLEKIETRYTAEWFDHIPKMLMDYCDKILMPVTCSNANSTTDLSMMLTSGGIDIYNIVGTVGLQKASAGAFLNFASTNVWKTSQAMILSRLFSEGHIKDGDVLYFTDAWNPTILTCKYMIDLCGIDVKIHAQWHAGAHDPWDLLAQRIPDPLWAKNLERALYFAIDKNYFTTNFYREMFASNLGLHIDHNFAAKTVRCGYPNSYLLKLSEGDFEKEDLVLFPHRLASEKQIEFFDSITPELKARGIKVDVCQRNGYNKEQYHAALRKAKVVVSFALQETYGIAQTEAVFAKALPLSPDRLSYSEMYDSPFLMPSHWTDTPEHCEVHRNDVIDRITSMVSHYDKYDLGLLEARKSLIKHYIGDETICRNLIGE